MLAIKIIIAIMGFVVAILFGYLLKAFLLQKKKGNIELELKELELEAERERGKMIQDAIIDIQERKTKIEKEKNLLENNLLDLERRERLVKKIQKENELLRNKYIKQIEFISGISKEEAYQEILKMAEEENEKDISMSIQKMENEKKYLLEEKAKDIIGNAIQKYSNEINRSLMSTVVKIDSDDEKGKLIGKDGRNIRAFERVTGVQLIIDEGPEYVTISSFDPIRREIANRVLEKMLDDGVVQPAKIEEYYQESSGEVWEIIEKKGRDAAEEVGAYNLDPELIQILGRLYFRTSYGQNVLQHSLEMAHIGGAIAAEIGADVNVVKVAALFHDIGKAVDYETEGTHVEIGRRILKQYKIDKEVIKAMQSHHREYPNENLESYIIDTADVISATRPGARSDNAEMYLQKMEGLERITSEFDGVSEVHALSAGREIRVFVKPDIINEYAAKKIAKAIAYKIEDELKYPGEIKVAVIRETKVIEFAR